MTGFKLVTINYNEQASLIVRAETDEEARDNILKTFEHIPGLEIISIEEAPEEAVNEALGQTEERTLN